MKIEGKGGISAEVIADSINKHGDRITSMQLHYHRFIHAEFLRQRMLSHSVSSSRAIPVKKMMDQVEGDFACPIYWGRNEPGMSASEEVPQPRGNGFDVMWGDFANSNCTFAKMMEEKELHKQIANRVLEPFQFINQVVTATDYDNFYYLRLDNAAQPEIQELAKVMYEAMKNSIPVLLLETEYHLPFISDKIKSKHSKENQIKISASLCAQHSYRVSDPTLGKAKIIYDKLVNSRPLHASPFEHIAKPFKDQEYELRLKQKDIMKNGLMKLDFDSDYAETKSKIIMYEGNFKGWSQVRKEIKDETCNEYIGK